MQIPNWQYTGSTIITPEYIRLTPDMQSRRGAIWNTVVCRSVLQNDLSFTSVFPALNDQKLGATSTV